MAESSQRTLSADEVAYVTTARDKAFVLYEGVRTPHRSCGIALAETFGVPTPAYQALRRGGITGCGSCGAIRAGEQVLGELLGDPSPTGMVTPALRDAVIWYQEAWQRRLVPDQPSSGPEGSAPNLGPDQVRSAPATGPDQVRSAPATGPDQVRSAPATGPDQVRSAPATGPDQVRSAKDIVCNNLVRPHGDFMGAARKAFCTNLAADVAALTAEALCRFAPEARPVISPLEP